MLQTKINELKKEIIFYSNHVLNMVHNSLKGLTEKDGEILKKLIRTDEDKANELELKIDEMCLTIIAQFSPKAKDLRLILMILKINNDLERIADHTVNIAESSLYIIDKPQVKKLIDIPAMEKTASKMLEDAIQAFVKEDDKLATDIITRDNIVDNLQEQILRELITHMFDNPKTINRSLHLSRISHNIERIADLSTNIAEDVIFLKKGETVKHWRGSHEQ
jgi:phosphate transport system protein